MREREDRGCRPSRIITEVGEKKQETCQLLAIFVGRELLEYNFSIILKVGLFFLSPFPLKIYWKLYSCSDIIVTLSSLSLSLPLPSLQISISAGCSLFPFSVQNFRDGELIDLKSLFPVAVYNNDYDHCPNSGNAIKEEKDKNLEPLFQPSTGRERWN